MPGIDRRIVIQGAAFATMIAASTGASAEAGDLYVIAELVSKPEKADDLRKLLVPFVALSRKEPGCKSYALLEVQGEAGRFLTFETWTDKAALDGHMKTPHIAELVPKLGDLLAKPFTQILMNAVSV